MDNFLVAVFVITIVVAAGIFQYRSMMRRRAAMAAVAARLGFRYLPDTDATRLNKRFDHIDLLQRGYDRCTANHLLGTTDGYPVAVCDFTYDTGSGRNRTEHNYGVVFVVVPMDMPEVIIRAEGLFDKLAAAVGLDDIDFESAEFSNSFHVSSADRKFAYDIIPARAIEHFLAHPDYDWELEGDTIAMYQDGRFKPEEIPRAIAIATGFVKLIPEFVWAAHGTTAARKDFHA